MCQQSLCSNSFFDCQGRQVCTWTSPKGQNACIDYLLVPKEMQAGLRTVGRLEGFVDMYEFDHQPLAAEISWTKVLPAAGNTAKINTRAIDTVEGRCILQRIFSAAPVVDWKVDVDTHLLTVNQYLHNALAASFPAPLQRTFLRQLGRLCAFVGVRNAMVHEHVLYMRESFCIPACRLGDISELTPNAQTGSSVAWNGWRQLANMLFSNCPGSCGVW